MILATLILATNIQAYSSCSTVLKAWEARLQQWSSETRHTTPDYELHRYHAVKKDGTTVFMNVVATLASRGPGRANQGWQLDDVCEFDGQPGVVMFKVEVRK